MACGWFDYFEFNFPAAINFKKLLLQIKLQLCSSFHNIQRSFIHESEIFLEFLVLAFRVNCVHWSKFFCFLNPIYNMIYSYFLLKSYLNDNHLILFWISNPQQMCIFLKLPFPF